MRYACSAEGNLCYKTLPDGQQWYYAWDGAGQLSQVTRPDGYAVAFTYDALGRRVSKRFRGRVTRWLWDGDKPLHEWHELEVGPGAGTAQDVATWLFEDESFAPTAKLTAKAAYSIVCDHLGTPLTMFDQLGKATWEMSLDSYGGVRWGRGKPQDCPFRYQGQYEDTETGLYYNRFRYFDPETGAYISQDPIGIVGGLAPYAYVQNPNTWVDVFGLTERIYENAPYHGKADNAVKSKAPVNGQGALDNSVQVKNTSPRRVGVANEELVVLDRTRVIPNDVEIYHGHVRKWDELHPDMQNVLQKANLTDRKGRITGGCGK